MSEEFYDLINRREMLGAVTSAAVIGGMLDAAAAQPSAPTSVPSPFGTRPRMLSDVRADLDNSRWTKAKHHLAGLKGFEWLQPFDIDLNSDLVVFNRTDDLLKHTLPPFDPYQVESLISSASTLLDRCLAYRREFYDLEEQAVRRALEYKLFLDQREPLEAIELAAYVEEQRRLEQQGQHNGAIKFGYDRLSDLSKGFAAVTEGSATSSAKAIEGEQDRKKNVRKKWAALDEYQTALQARHSTPGHPLNYRERLDRTRAFLEQDIGIAYQKIRCIQPAVNKIFGLSSSLKPPFEVGYLDYLVIFLRDVIEQVEVATVEEVDFEHVVSLHQPRALKPDSSSQSQLVPSGPWNAAFGAGYLSFSLDKEFPQAVKRLRIRAIGVSMLSESPADENNRLRSSTAIIFPPSVDDLLSPGNASARPPVLIEKICQYDPAATRLAALQAVNNIDPRVDKWQLQLSTNLMFPDGNSHGRSVNQIKEIKLHLKLSAILDKAPASWSDLSL